MDRSSWIRSVGIFVLALTICPGMAMAKLRKAQVSACTAYLAELQAAAGDDPIIDSRDESLTRRLQLPDDEDFALPKYPDLQAHGEVVVAFIVERDGRIQHAKVVWSYGAAGLSEASLRAVQQAKYEQAGLFDKKPARLFCFRVFTFFNGT